MCSFQTKYTLRVQTGVLRFAGELNGDPIPAQKHILSVFFYKNFQFCVK